VKLTGLGLSRWISICSLTKAPKSGAEGGLEATDLLEEKPPFRTPSAIGGTQTPFSDGFRTPSEPLAGVGGIPFAVIIAVISPIVEQRSPTSAAALRSFIHSSPQKEKARKRACWLLVR
jgi:hypothetical protein